MQLKCTKDKRREVSRGKEEVMIQILYPYRECLAGGASVSTKPGTQPDSVKLPLLPMFMAKR